MRRLFSTALIAALMTGCATGYQSAGSSGGFSDVQVAPDLFVIKFVGNEHTPGERAAHFGLLRSAEVALTNGFPYFEVVDGRNISTTNSYELPSNSYTTGTVATTGSLSTYSGSTTTTPGQVYSTYAPGIGLLVRGLKDRTGHEQAIDAALFAKMIRAKYKID
jgi:hypothetical protein